MPFRDLLPADRAEIWNGLGEAFAGSKTLHLPRPQIRIDAPANSRLMVVRTSRLRLAANLMLKRFVVPLGLVCLIPMLAVAEDWPQFRGVHSNGRSTPEQPLPTNIGPEKHVVWKTELPPGHSSPVIFGDKIFLTAVREKEHLETLCLDRVSGKILWRIEAPHKTLEQIHGIGSYAQPSPAADAERVVAMFGSSGLYCYDHAGRE